MNRRTFLKITGMGSISLAAGCNSPEKILFSQIHAPDDMVSGRAIWYASTCRQCPAGCGILAKNREGRIIKLEGNPLHPINRGKLCMRGQAALQEVYNPDRLKTPLLKEKGNWRQISFSEAMRILRSKTERASQKGPDRIRMVTEVVGETLLGLFSDALKNWNSQGPLIYEPYAYESLKTANDKVFGLNALISYRMDRADLLVSFGADFLETWLSPVEYARKFKAMHAVNKDEKGLFIHIHSYQSLTGANADIWLACKPGSGTIVALGLLREVLNSGKGKNLPQSFLKALYKATKAYTRDRVIELSGLSLPQYEKLALCLMDARSPLVLGTGTGAGDLEGLTTNVIANLLNLLLDPRLKLLDFTNRHRVEIASKRSDILKFFENLESTPIELLFLNNVNPIFSLPEKNEIKQALEKEDLFVVSFSNFMDDTSGMADLIVPVRMSLETWDEYGGWQSINSTIQPAMGGLTTAPHLGDVILNTAFGTEKPAENYKSYLFSELISNRRIADEAGWAEVLQKGGLLTPAATHDMPRINVESEALVDLLSKFTQPQKVGLTFMATPSVRFFDGRGANKPWLCEIPDPLLRVAWQSPVIMHPDTARTEGITQEDIIQIKSQWGRLEAPVYINEFATPGLLVMNIGQGHQTYGRYAEGRGLNPNIILPQAADPHSGGPLFSTSPVTIHPTGRKMRLAKIYGSRTQHGRTFALTVRTHELKKGKPQRKSGLRMGDFPLTLPLPEGYNPERDFYPPHDHDKYRWAMVVDLDRCIGCGACTAACYAENNIGIVGQQQMVNGREMSWLSVERYQDPHHMAKITFLPLPCQHCDNAPCESVCPVYAPHHSKEGINNQIYNRCIGTRFCAQNCPYKVRRFNWFAWDWPKPMNLQLNPDVTVRSKGVMEKCSFCIQRIKVAHSNAKNETRMIRDGEVIPACVQTCPTDALCFGNLMDNKSRVRMLAAEPRAYQIMGYLNTKPAVIYLKKVLQEA
ncbi:MAG: 4Fe-4S dicluster domain-containing protein [Deltaproteobacteria bacterium]|nr:4Fe-4S dicluster domain-containing protein [Deltaproteobacteria bacterium]